MISSYKYLGRRADQVHHFEAIASCMTTSAIEQESGERARFGAASKASINYKSTHSQV
jgi:hypothetical protein